MKSLISIISLLFVSTVFITFTALTAQAETKLGCDTQAQSAAAFQLISEGYVLDKTFKTWIFTYVYYENKYGEEKEASRYKNTQGQVAYATCNGLFRSSLREGVYYAKSSSYSGCSAVLDVSTYMDMFYDIHYSVDIKTYSEDVGASCAETIPKSFYFDEGKNPPKALVFNGQGELFKFNPLNENLTDLKPVSGVKNPSCVEQSKQVQFLEPTDVQVEVVKQHSVPAGKEENVMYSGLTNSAANKAKNKLKNKIDKYDEDCTKAGGDLRICRRHIGTGYGNYDCFEPVWNLSELDDAWGEGKILSPGKVEVKGGAMARVQCKMPDPMSFAQMAKKCELTPIQEVSEAYTKKTYAVFVSNTFDKSDVEISKETLKVSEVGTSIKIINRSDYTVYFNGSVIPARGQLHPYGGDPKDSEVTFKVMPGSHIRFSVHPSSEHFLRFE